MSKASESVALKITNVFVQEDIFNEMLNTPVIYKLIFLKFG